MSQPPQTILVAERQGFRRCPHSLILLHAAGHRVIGLTQYRVLACGPPARPSLPTIIESSATSAPSAVFRSSRKTFASTPSTLLSTAPAPSWRSRDLTERLCRWHAASSSLPSLAFCLYTSSTSVYPQTAYETVDRNQPRSSAIRADFLREAENISLQAHGGVARLKLAFMAPIALFCSKPSIEGKAAIEGNHGEGRHLNQIHADDAASP
ncbi:MAG: hypothetical protein IPK32_26185 [Verrucomicrobiaceae bacterium]|nr:hypothetical protein [Verrucomicrobiaceae bacterium]